MSEQGAAFSPELSDAAFILRTGWTWEQYQAAPDDLVEKMVILLNAQAGVERMKMAEIEAQA